MTYQKPATAIVALGSNISENLDDSLGEIVTAIGELSSFEIENLNISEYFQTPAFPKGNGPDFVNCVVCFETRIQAAELLAKLHGIELLMKRERHRRWGQRNIDLDLISLGQEVLPNQEVFDSWVNLPLSQQMERTPQYLILPHPRMQDRAFVLVPMAQVAPNWRHPALGLTTTQLLAQLPAQEINEIRPFIPRS